MMVDIVALDGERYEYHAEQFKGLGYRLLYHMDWSFGGGGKEGDGSPYGYGFSLPDGTLWFNTDRAILGGRR